MPRNLVDIKEYLTTEIVAIQRIITETLNNQRVQNIFKKFSSSLTSTKDLFLLFPDLK